jgi:hypothetical protein
MNDNLKRMLEKTLKQYAEGLLKDNRSIKIKLKELNDIDNIMKILNNYTELEPLLKSFFEEKAKQEKWGRGS